MFVAPPGPGIRHSDHHRGAATLASVASSQPSARRSHRLIRQLTSGRLLVCGAHGAGSGYDVACTPTGPLPVTRAVPQTTAGFVMSSSRQLGRWWTRPRRRKRPPDSLVRRRRCLMSRPRRDISLRRTPCGSRRQQWRCAARPTCPRAMPGQSARHQLYAATRVSSNAGVVGKLSVIFAKRLKYVGTPGVVDRSARGWSVTSGLATAA